MPFAACGTTAASPVVHPYAAHVAEASHRFGIPEYWIWSVMRAESGGRSRAVSHAGAMGLMQIMPRTWTMLSARFGLGSDPFDIRANILAGAAYLRLMWDRYGDITLMLAAYNAGPGRVDDYRRGRRRLPSETADYVARIAPSLGAAAAFPVTSSSVTVAQLSRQRSLFALTRSAASATPEVAGEQQTGPVPPAFPDAISSRVRAGADQLFVPLSPQKP
ncbi:lytic transglycosylase domain-containing protein [Blastomonas aquatica]|nr:lytic transglycosylase domain-containing protein [Blastomonas aquatica]